MGAPDPGDGTPVQAAFDYSKALELWSLQPVRLPAPPVVTNKDWPRSDLDRFILAQLEAKQIQSAARPESEMTIVALFRRVEVQYRLKLQVAIARRTRI